MRPWMSAQESGEKNLLMNAALKEEAEALA
jgi:hypothetical protein